MDLPVSRALLEGRRQMRAARLRRGHEPGEHTGRNRDHGRVSENTRVDRWRILPIQSREDASHRQTTRPRHANGGGAA